MANNNKGKLTSAGRAILTTILYSDIFHFPLTREELWHFLIAKEEISRRAFDSSLPLLKEYIAHTDNYYCLIGREEIITKRKKNRAEVAKKMQQVCLIAGKLSAIPSLLFIGITGGLAAGNVTQDDDIDLVIIVKKNTLFLSRFLILSVLESLGVRRFRNQKNTADTICVNLLFDETALAWFENFQDIYTAREIAQIFPLFERNSTYHRFLAANSWIHQFLPNLTYHRPVVSKMQEKGIAKFGTFFVSNFLLETFFRLLQMSSMKKHQTRETITKHILAFHPIDYRVKTLRQLRLKMRQFGLLTKF